MNHKCKNWFVNLAGGEVYCDICGKENFFKDIGITAQEIIDAGGYNTIDKDGKIPQHDIEMIEYFYQCEIKVLKK